MPYDPQEIFRSAASLAAMGMKIVKLYGVRDDGTCTCRKGAACDKSSGKHPAGENWQAYATDDEETIAGWFNDTNENVRWNIGVRLGRASGIIDVEADSDDALEVLREYGLHEIDTVAYMGSRGPHYWFQFDHDLPDAAVIHVGPLEVRLGGGQLAAQSVVPKSWHRTGVQYQWIAGHSPEDTTVAKLPESFKRAIMENSRKKGQGCVAQARKGLVEEQFWGEGMRHPRLLGIASGLAMRIPVFTAAEQEQLIEIMQALNLQKCRPPKSPDEVRQLCVDQFEHYARRQNERGRLPLERFGLRYNHEFQEYEPGEWHVTVVYSQPVHYRLRIPPVNPGDTQTLVVLSIEEYNSARKTANAIQLASPKMLVADPNYGRWQAAWVGENIQDANGGRRQVRGLCAKLIEFSDEEHPPAETKNYTYLASILLGYLRQFDSVDSEGDEDSTLPNPSGVPKRIRVGGREELWFKWRETWTSATRKLPRGELTYQHSMDLRSRILAEVGLKEFEDRTKTVGGERGRWIVWTDRELKALEKLATS